MQTVPEASDPTSCALLAEAARTYGQVLSHQHLCAWELSS